MPSSLCLPLKYAPQLLFVQFTTVLLQWPHLPSTYQQVQAGFSPPFVTPD